jgi:hypothetical protein
LSSKRIQWRTDVEYRCFVDPEAARLTLVTDHLRDDVQGRGCGSILIVFDENGFCDLEATDVRFEPDTERPTALRDISATTTIFDALAASCSAKSSSSDVVVTLGDGGSWFRLNGSAVALRILDGKLTGIHFSDPIEDIGGHAESRWLSEVEARQTNP